MAWMIEKPTLDIREAICQLRYDKEMQTMREGLAHFKGSELRAHVRKVAEMAKRVYSDPKVDGLTSFQNRYRKIEELCLTWLSDN
jgi:hypothetical protein